MPLTPMEGDRIQEDHGELTVVTPPSKDNPRNFGPASSRDKTVYTCERPGGDPKEKGAQINTSTEVAGWVQYMSSQGIEHVIVLLGREELDVYTDPGLIQAYSDAGMVVHHIPYSSTNSYMLIMEVLDGIHSMGESAVAHCTHGMGRSGRVAAGWLVHKYGLSIEDAVLEALASAREAGVERMGSPQQLREWMVVED
jgi:protein-tyrosine phosphatase